LRGASYQGVSFENGGSTRLSLKLTDLRPQSTYDSGDDEFVLVAREIDPTLTEIHGTWEITARGHHRVYSGHLVVPVVRHELTVDAVAKVVFPDDADVGDES
jgi:hypothetical protein